MKLKRLFKHSQIVQFVFIKNFVWVFMFRGCPIDSNRAPATLDAVVTEVRIRIILYSKKDLVVVPGVSR